MYELLRIFTIVNLKTTQIQLKLSLNEILKTYFHSEMTLFSNKFNIPLDISFGEFHQDYYLKSFEYKSLLNDWNEKKGTFFKDILFEESQNFVKYYIHGKPKTKKIINL